jgi:hypothetical protein
MSYERILSGAKVERSIDMQTVINLLTEKFGAIKQAHAQLHNLVWLGGKMWWVITSTSEHELDLCSGKNCDKYELLKQINNLHAGVLIFRQLEDNLLFIYLIDNIEKLKAQCLSPQPLEWSTIDYIKLFSETGIMIGGELIGFRKFRQMHNLTFASPAIAESKTN